MKVLGYAIHVLALIMLGLGAFVFWELFIPLAVLLELAYWGIFYLMLERTKNDGM